MSAGRVLVVDDDAAIRDATALFLRVNGLPAETYASAAEFLDSYRPAWSGCLLLDLKMPGIDGLELLRVLTDRRSPLQIVVVTAHGDVGTTRAALKGGAFDFLEKPVENAVLLDVTRQALVTPKLPGIALSYPGDASARIARLTARERQVMGLLVEGRQNRDVAVALGISPRTVEVYKARLMEKLRVGSVAELVRLALGVLASPPSS